MAWGRGVAIAAVVVLLTAGLAASLPIGEAEPGVGALEAAFAWSRANEDSLLSGWVLAAGLAGNTPQAVQAYEQGMSWANQRIETADRAALDVALGELLASYGAKPVHLDAVPEAVVPGLATLVEAQLHLSVPSTATFGEQESVVRHAWLLGVVEVVSASLGSVPLDQWPQEPVLVDPVGLVIVGGSGDDVYERPSGVVQWNGPILLVEPGGGDTYEIDVASTVLLDTDMGTDGYEVGIANIAIEMAGDDLYANRVASNRQGELSLSLLIEEEGDDLYGRTDRRSAVAAAVPGDSLLIDKDGNDAYKTRDNGIAYAHNLGAGNPIAVLDERAGNDTYTARTQRLDEGFTHAAAMNTGAIAILRDRAGSDSYSALFAAYASSEDGAATLFLDEQGNDHYHIYLHGGTSYGSRYASEHGLDSIGNRGLAWFTDANGNDSYTHDDQCCDPLSVGNDHYRTLGHPNLRYSIYQDCTTPPQSDTPCPQNDEANRAYLTGT